MTVDFSPPLTFAWSVADGSTPTFSSFAVPDGLAIHCETSTSTVRLSMVAADGTR